jgi:hypothetical protein
MRWECDPIGDYVIFSLGFDEGDFVERLGPGDSLGLFGDPSEVVDVPAPFSYAQPLDEDVKVRFEGNVV